MHQKFRLWAIIMVLFSMLLSVGGIAFGRGLPDYALWHQKMGVQAEAILKPYQITNVVLTHPTEGQATAWFQAEKFQQAFPVLKQYAGQGSHRAQLEVGFMYQYGKGVPQDFQLAALWYYIAADPTPDSVKPMQRGLDAYFGLDGESVDYQAAAEWFQMAAELSDDRY